MYRGQRKNFMGSVGPKGAAKQVTEIVDVFELFFNRVFVGKIVETNRFAEHFLRGHKLSGKLLARAWKPVAEVVVIGLFMLIGIIQKPSLRSYFRTKRVISTPGFGLTIT
jgi:hypothetical protein